MKRRIFNKTNKYRSILSAVHMVYRLVNSTYNVRELALRLTRLLCQFIRASSCSIYILDPEKKELVLKGIYDNKINILIDKKRDLKMSKKEASVTQGMSIVEKRFIGLPLVSDDCVGAIFIRRASHEPPFDEFDKDMLSVFAEQSVTAIKNLQLYDEQQNTILSSMKFIGSLLEKQRNIPNSNQPAYFKIVKLLAEKLHMSQRDIELLQHASILHDAGAIDVPYEILSKTSQLSPEEFKVIRDLPSKSAALIKPVAFLRPVLPFILYHHEKYDGSGYPSGLKKEQIPLGARIMAVVDAFDAMIKGRPYKKALTTDEALKELQKNSGSQFDPKVVQAFTSLAEQKKFRKSLSLLKQ